MYDQTYQVTLSVADNHSGTITMNLFAAGMLQAGSQDTQDYLPYLLTWCVCMQQTMLDPVNKEVCR